MTKAKKWLSRVAEKLSPSPASPPFAEIGADHLNALVVEYSIMGYPDVKEATFNEHEEGEISLELKVGTTIPESAGDAKLFGLSDNAVRMAKSFLEPGTVGKQVGKLAPGSAHYGISVYRPDGVPIACGRQAGSPRGRRTSEVAQSSNWPCADGIDSEPEAIA